MSINFNEKSGEGADKADKTTEDEKPYEDVLEHEKRSGQRTRFVSKPSPMVERAYQIFEYNLEKGDYDHVGDYVLIDKSEKREITEKKVINLMTLLNGKKDLIDLSDLTKKRVLFTLIPETAESIETRMIFKDYDGKGVSKDNAVFTIRKGVFNG